MSVTREKMRQRVERLRKGEADALALLATIREERERAERLLASFDEAMDREQGIERPGCVILRDRLPAPEDWCVRRTD